MNPYLDVILRSAAVYLFMVIALRIFGKKELSQLKQIADYEGDNFSKAG